MGADMQTEQENCWAVSGQIKKYRGSLKLSQEELAEKVYVSRQSISNWENGKNYPDIHSLLLLSTLFNVSLDQLIKGDVEMMEQWGILLAVTLFFAFKAEQIKKTTIFILSKKSRHLCRAEDWTKWNNGRNKASVRTKRFCLPCFAVLQHCLFVWY